jgi:hypothetical protein
MADPRLNSMHFELEPRRQAYRQAREELLSSRGWVTLALEKVHDLSDNSDVWPALLPIHPDQILPGTKFLLIDLCTRQAYPLRPGLNTIGRFPDNDVVLEEIWISRRHAALLVHTGGRYVLHDTASRNGTFVNGRRIDEPTRLHRGDEIKISQRRLVFVSESDCGSEDPMDNHPETAILG